MGFDALKREREEIYKARKVDKQLNYLVIAVILISVFAVFTGLKGSFIDFLFSTPNWNLEHYPLLFLSEILIFIFILLWWKGNRIAIPLIVFKKKKKIIYPAIRKVEVFYKLNYYIQKIPFIKDLFFFLNFKGKENELNEFFYQAPKQTDELQRAKNIIFTKYTLRDVFKEDYENIVNLFRGKDFKEKEKTFLDLIAIIEGVFEDYSKGMSKIYINEKNLPSPLRVDNILKAGVFDKKEGKIYFSTKQMIDVIDDFSDLFEKFIINYSKYRTRISQIYSNTLKDEKVRKQLLIYFKLVMFRKFLKLYMNIPSGWLVIRLEDYPARAIISNIDRESLVIIDSRNKGEIKGFPDDRIVRMFQVLYHYFFTKTEYAKQFQNMFEIMSPDMTAKEIEEFILKNRNDLENELVKEENERE